MSDDEERMDLDESEQEDEPRKKVRTALRRGSGCCSAVVGPAWALQAPMHNPKCMRCFPSAGPRQRQTARQARQEASAARLVL